MFKPNCCKLVRFRYKKELDEKKHSFLHTKGSSFAITNVDAYVDWGISLSLINYDNEERHKTLELFADKHGNFKNVCGRVQGIIESGTIKLDFLEIKKILLKTNNKKEKKLRENCRVMAVITNLRTSENVYFVSNILRDKGPGVCEELNILSVGRPPSITSWRRLILTLANQVPYYPDEMKLMVNGELLDSHTEENEKLRYNIFVFHIPDAILDSCTDLQCVLQCPAFQKGVEFSVHTGLIDKRKEKNEKNFLKRSYPSSNDILTRISGMNSNPSTSNSSNELSTESAKKKKEDVCSMSPGTSCQVQCGNEDFAMKFTEEDYKNYFEDNSVYTEAETQGCDDIQNVLNYANEETEFQDLFKGNPILMTPSFDKSHDEAGWNNWEDILSVIKKNR